MGLLVGLVDGAVGERSLGADRAPAAPDLDGPGIAVAGQRGQVLGSGELDKKLTVKAHAFSASAIAKITGAGGSAEVLPRRQTKADGAAEEAETSAD